MKNPIGIVVPNSINTPKKYAKKLNKIYPAQQLSKCQAVTAKLYGHQDWFNLEAAIQHKMKSAFYNEDLFEQAYEERLNEQMRILARELGGVDMDESYMITDMFANMEDEVRNDLANKRNAQLLVETVIADLSPTDRSVWVYDLPLGELTILDDLPAALSRWWEKNIPHQPEVAVAISRFKLDVQSRIDMVEFGHYWGVLSRHYTQSLPESLRMGVTYMLAIRYAELSLTTDTDFNHANQQYLDGNMGKQEYIKEVNTLRKQETQRYLNGYPVDRYAFLNVIADHDLINSMRAAIKLLQS